MAIRNFNKTTPKLGERVFIDPTALVLGNATIGDDTSIWPMAVIRGDVNTITIGARCSIQDGTIIHVNHDSPEYKHGSTVTIGDDVTVGHRVIIHGATIHTRCLIGMGAIIMDHAVVEENSIIGAGSLVPTGKVLTGGHLWVGSPVKQIRPLTDKEKTFLRYSAQHYVNLKDKHRQDPSN